MVIVISRKDTHIKSCQTNQINMTKEQTSGLEETLNKLWKKLGDAVDLDQLETVTSIKMATDMLISKTISQEKEKMIEEFRKKLTNAEMTLVFSSTTGKDTTQKVPMYQPQQIEELVNLLQNK